MPTLSVKRRATTVGSAMTFRASSARALPQSRLFAPCRAVSRSSGASPRRSSLGHRSTGAKGSRRRYASKTTAAWASVLSLGDPLISEFWARARLDRRRADARGAKELYLNRVHAGGQHYLRALHVNRSWVFRRSKYALSRRPSLQFERRDLKVSYSLARAQLKLALQVIYSPIQGGCQAFVRKTPLTFDYERHIFSVTE